MYVGACNGSGKGPLKPKRPRTLAQGPHSQKDLKIRSPRSIWEIVFMI